MAVFNTNSVGQTVLIDYWNFNNFTTVVTLPAVASLAADYSILDTSKARMTDEPIPGTSSAYSSYCDQTTGDTTNARQGAAAGNCFRARNPNDSMQLLFYMPTTGYTNLVFKYATETSSYTSGDSIQVFSYSIDSGATWITSGSGLSEWVDSAQLTFTLKTITINDAAAYNNRKFVFRIHLVGRNSGTSGNNRFDNVTLEGSGPSGVAEVKQSVYSVYPNPVKDQIDINGSLDGNKSVLINNILGQEVFAGSVNGTHFSVNASNLNSGIYFITIRENNTGGVSKMKFIKQ